MRSRLSLEVGREGETGTSVWTRRNETRWTLLRLRLRDSRTPNTPEGHRAVQAQHKEETVSVESTGAAPRSSLSLLLVLQLSQIGAQNCVEVLELLNARESGLKRARLSREKAVRLAIEQRFGLPRPRELFLENF
mmetsp:Transcript_1926/g.5870  ORF Transcript_1926/g.5870 Transcript_1926/m.5870 type:complete len:135 (-) Transcript_1926:142-546(-)